MTEEEKILVDRYLEYKHVEECARNNAIDTKKQLAKLSPHKVGEIIMWKETGSRKRVGGTMLHPVYEQLPDVEKRAVLVKVEACIDTFRNNEVSYRNTFSLIKKDGGIHANSAYPRGAFVWTGEIHESYKQE